MPGRNESTSSYRERNSTAERALEVLSMFTDDLTAVSGNEVADRLGVARSTAYRYLQSLVTSRFLEEAPGGGFRLGLRILELARIARKSYGLSELAGPALTALAKEVEETVLLTRRSGALVVCLDRAEAQSKRVRISYERGSVLPINAGASALVLLAWTDPAEAQTILESSELQRFTPATLTDVGALMKRLTHIRQAGFAVSRSELDHDVLGIAAPIFDGASAVVAAVSVAAVASRIAPEVEHGIAQQVRETAQAISSRLAVVEG